MQRGMFESISQRERKSAQLAASELQAGVGVDECDLVGRPVSNVAGCLEAKEMGEHAAADQRHRRVRRRIDLFCPCHCLARMR